MFDDKFFTNDFFTTAIYPEDLLRKYHSKRCPNCGLTFDDFNRQGRFGCHQCYESLEPQVGALVKRLQGSTTYEGRIPKRGGGLLSVKREIQGLRHAMEQAVKAENFEEAMKLRDRIKFLEARLAKG